MPAELVRELRGDLSHDRFAEALGTSRHTVIRWEKGTIPEAYAEALAKYSRGKYKPEDFNPRLTITGAVVRTGERLTALERQVAELAKRIQKLERGRRA